MLLLTKTGIRLTSPQHYYLHLRHILTPRIILITIHNKVQLMLLPSQNPIISGDIYIQTGFTFLVSAYPGCAGKEAVERV